MPEAAAPANPFLEAAPTHESPAVQAAPISSQRQQAAPVSSQRQGAPLRVTPGAESPVIRDAHAEFRRGNWKKPALFLGLAALVLGALFFLVPSEEAQAPEAAKASAKPEGVIGASLPPSRSGGGPEAIPTAPLEPAAAPTPPTAAPAEVAKADTSKPSGDFASAFKSAANRR